MLIDLMTVTPSFVILGSPPSYSQATLRPPGPSVTYPAYESRYMPATKADLASAPCKVLTFLYDRGHSSTLLVFFTERYVLFSNTTVENSRR